MSEAALPTDHWCSPRSIRDGLLQLFGGPVGCDPCSNERSIIQAEMVMTWGGLHLPWAKPRSRNRTAYMNNPYSSNLPWIKKSNHELTSERLDELVTLMMVAPSTDWWQKKTACKRFNPRLIFTPRLKFIGDQKHGARFDTVLAYFGTRVRSFEREFKHVTRWVAWGR